MNHDAFLRAIEAAPDDDLVRLAFADWLDERGDADRARFIRLQCEYCRLFPTYRPPQADAKRGRELSRQIGALLKKHRAAWTAGLPAWTAESNFERGFLNAWRMTGKQFLDSAAALRAVAPISTLFLRLLGKRDAAVCASEHLAGVGWLAVDDSQMTDAGVAALATNRHLPLLAMLSMGRSSYGDAKDANKLTDAALAAVAASACLSALGCLDVAGYKKVTPAGLRALLESRRLPKLSALDASGGSGGAEFGEAFRSPRFALTSLTRLTLSDRKLGQAGAEALATSPSLKSLRSLSLERNKLGDRGALALAASPHLAGLEYLDLDKNALSDAAVRALLAAPHLRQLHSLDLSGNPRVGDDSARAILDDRRTWHSVGLGDTSVSPALIDEVKRRCKAD